MGYQGVMGYPHCPDLGKAKIYGLLGVMGYQTVWVTREVPRGAALTLCTAK